MSDGPGGSAWRELARYGRRVIPRDPVEVWRLPRRALIARRSRHGAPGGFRFSNGGIAAPVPSPLPLRVRHAGAVPATIALATGEWALSKGAPWRAAFDDPEDRFSAHRFSWVIPALADHGAAAVPVMRELLEWWLAEHPAPRGDGWDSYSIAERTAAAVYLHSCAPAGGASLLSAIGAHARALASALEFRGSSTNNHLMNDARALYLAGGVLGDGRLRHQARELFDFAVPRMFVRGFLREGSTHYHLLLLRTLAEVAVAARESADEPFAGRAAEWAREAARAARFFAADAAEMPLIGDLSPDFTPGFLHGFAAALECMLHDAPGDVPAAGWPSLFVDRAAVSAGEDGAASSSDAGYYRAAAGGFRLWSFVNPDGYVPAWSHAHADLGSFVASWHGRPLLVDAGRATYEPGAMSDFGRSVRSHNAFSIDGAEPCLVHGLNAYPELFRSDYVDARPRARVSADAGGAVFDVAHEGFGRLGSGISVSRRVTMSRTGLHVEDAIAGSGRHRVETFFHFAPEADVAPAGPSRWTVALTGVPALRFEIAGAGGAALVRGRGGNDPMGFTARRYGAAVPSPSLIIARDVTLPHTARFSLTCA